MKSALDPGNVAGAKRASPADNADARRRARKPNLTSTLHSRRGAARGTLPQASLVSRHVPSHGLL